MVGGTSPQELYQGEDEDFRNACDSLNKGNQIDCQEVDIYIEKCCKPLRPLILKFVNDVSSAEDVLQEFRISTCEILANIQRRKDLILMSSDERASYWKCIAIRRRADFHRNHFREKNLIDKLHNAKVIGELVVEETPSSPELLVEQCINNDNDEIREALAKLSQEQRLAFVMNRVARWTAQEIADYYGQPVATVRSHIQKARSRLGITKSRTSRRSSDEP
jgi:RNA polymerase sigma factor (sigma-70 family)